MLLADPPGRGGAGRHRTGRRRAGGHRRPADGGPRRRRGAAARARRAARRPASTDRRVFATLSELEGHLESLVGGVKQFNAELQRLLRDDSGELDTFHDVKQATVAYLQEFVTNLDGRQRSITEAVGRIEVHGLAELRQRALRATARPPRPGAVRAAGHDRAPPRHDRRRQGGAGAFEQADLPVVAREPAPAPRPDAEPALFDG